MVGPCCLGGIVHSLGSKYGHLKPANDGLEDVVRHERALAKEPNRRLLRAVKDCEARAMGHCMAWHARARMEVK